MFFRKRADGALHEVHLMLSDAMHTVPSQAHDMISTPPPSNDFPTAILDSTPVHADLGEVPGTASGLPPAGSGVIDASGEFGTVMSHEALHDAGNDGLSRMVVVRHREQQVLLPGGLFQAVSPTSFRIPVSFSALISTRGAASNGSIVIPVLQEEMSIGTRLIDSGRGMRVRKQVVETAHEVERDLLQDRLAVEHVAIDRLLDDTELPQTRQEGDVFIVPVIEEVIVVQTRRRLKEEIRITRTSELVRQRQTVMLRAEQVTVERFDDAVSATANASVATTNPVPAPAAVAPAAATDFLPTHVTGGNADGMRSDPIAPGAASAPGRPGALGALQGDVSTEIRLSS